MAITIMNAICVAFSKKSYYKVNMTLIHLQIHINWLCIRQTQL